jgi:hypothetical protein
VFSLLLLQMLGIYAGYELMEYFMAAALPYEL